MTRMNKQWWGKADHDPVHKTAADWFVRLQDEEVTVEEMLAWQHWIGMSARHAAAFDRVEEAWEAAQGVSWNGVNEMDSREAQPPLTRTLSPRRGERGKIRTWGRVALAASFGFLIVGAMWAGLNFSALPWGGLGAEVLSTDIGKNRTVRLEDGSLVTLGGDSKIRVSFGQNERLIELARGEALFSVARDKNRPFSVRAGNASVVAVGTEFNVRRGDERTVVAVLEGRVLVNEAPVSVPMQWLKSAKSQQTAVPLDAGQQTVVGKQGVRAATRLANPATAAAWRTGLLSFQREPLREVLLAVNRYAIKPIEIGDTAIGDFRFTGTVMDNNIDEWIDSLEKAFRLRAAEEEERIVLRKEPAMPLEN